MTNYSARHWAEVAKQEADRASQGGGQADPTVFARKLDDNLHQEVSDFGTYNGQEVQSGEVFVGQDGRLWQYTKQQEDTPQGLVWESISQNTPASSDFPVLGLDDGLGRIVIPQIDSQYVTISDDYGHNWRREFLNTKFSGTAGSVVAKYHNNVVHTGTQYVYFGTQNVMVSQDGVEWDSLGDYFDNNGDAVVLQGVTGAVYFNGVYVLSDSSGQVYYSYDGLSLDKSSITDGRITMSPGGFVLCVRGSASMTSGELLSISYNGIDWITRSPEGSFPAPETQAVSDGITIVQCAPCYSEVSSVNVSPDGGLSWTSMPLPFICKPRLSYIGGKFIILQNDEQSDVLLWSEDGYTWNTEYLMALGTWRTVCFSAGVWSFLGDLDTIVASSWNTGSSTGSTYPSLQLLSYNEADIHMLLQQTGLEASKVDMLTVYNLQTVLLREEGTVYIANDTFDYEPIGQTGLYSQIYRGHIYKLQSDDNGLMHLIDITPEPEIEQLSISTEEQALAGVDDTTAMSPLKTFSVIADNVGRGVQLGFNGTLSEGVLTFEVPSENAGEYTLKHLYNYEIDLLFEAVGQLDDSTQIVIKNGTQNINIVNAKHDDYNTPVTVGDMKQIMKYSADIGFRWIFDARYTVTTDEQPVFVMPSTVTNSPTTQDGVTVFEGDNHPVVIKGQAGTTATGLQVQDSLEAGSAVDFEHYRSGDQYGIQFTVDNSKATTGGTQYWRSYVTDGGVSVTDFTTQNSVLVPTPSDTDISARAVNTSWFNGNAMRKPSEGVPTGLKTFGYSDDAKELYYRGGSLTSPYTLQLDHKGAFPSSDYTDIEVVASGTTFTAPCAGFFAVRGTATAAGGRIELHNTTAGDLTIKSVEPNADRVVAGYLPCNTGDTLRVYYADVNINLFRLVKAKGETL